MRRRLAALWPSGLAGRLGVLLVAALACAQVVLIVVLRDEQASVVETMIHGQALNQTVTLARLLTQAPPSEGERLTTAFGSRESCARVSTTEPPIDATPDAAEIRLADILAAMLHDVDAGTPRVSIERLHGGVHPCETEGTPPPRDRTRGGVHRAHFAAVDAVVPLVGGRWLSVRTAVEAPPGWTRATLLSFVLSALATVAVVVVVVRHQTRSLRALADAADRFGRGEKIARLPETGPREVVAASRAFDTMRERLGRFHADRLRLLAGISHDLRTPLTTLRLKAEFIDDEAMRDGIIATIDELTVITEATLAFTRAEATSEETEVVDLTALAADVVAAFRLADADVTMAPGAPLRLACRPVSLKRALRNLIENAVRYGGNARVAVALGNDAPVLTVDDDGPGLPSERMEEAFQPFVRLEPSRSTETGGIGLGLAIARGIVEAHGGTLTLANRSEGGLHAEIRLPSGATKTDG